MMSSQLSFAGLRSRSRSGSIACTWFSRRPSAGPTAISMRSGLETWVGASRIFGDGPLDARNASLGDVLEEVGLRSIKYLYDFGDGWEHSVRIERVTEAKPGAVDPRLIEATGCFSPEDIGGPWGYGEFLSALTDPNHERHTEFLVWSGGKFDPNAVDVERHVRGVAALARRWSRSPAIRRKRSN
jgi:hypothetical protein